MNKLKEIQSITDKQIQQDELMKYLYDLNLQGDASIYRLCYQINGHIEFLLRLSKGQDPHSLFLISQQSGRTFLKQGTRGFLAEQAAKSTELISTLISQPNTPLYSISRLFDQGFDPEMRTRVLCQLANDENVSISELKVLLIQEAYIVQQLLQSRSQPNEQLRISIENELELKYQSKIAQLQQKISELSNQYSLNNTSNLREILEDNIRAEYELKLTEEREKIRLQLQAEYKPVRTNTSPVDTSDSKLIRELKTQITNEIRNQVIDDVRKDVWLEAEFHFRPIIKKELEQKLRERIKDELEFQIREKLSVEIEQNLRRQITLEVRQSETEKIRQELTKTLTEEISSKLKQKIQNDMNYQLQLQLNDNEIRIRREIEQKIRETLTKEYNERMNDKIEHEIKPALQTQLTVTLQREIRQKLSQQIRDSVIEDVRIQIEEENRRNGNNSSNILRIKEELQQKMDQENKIKLQMLENDLRRQIYDETKQKLINEFSNSTEIDSEFHDLKQAFRNALEKEIRINIASENVSSPISVEKENKIRNQIYQQIYDESIERITREVENRYKRRNYFDSISDSPNSSNSSAKTDTELLRKKIEMENEMRKQLEFELRMKIENELREKIENEIKFKYETSFVPHENQRRMKTELRQIVIDEIRNEFMSESTNNKDLIKLKNDIISFLTPTIEKEFRQSYLEIDEETEKITTNSYSPNTLKNIKKQVKNEIKEKYLSVLRKDVEADFSNCKSIFDLVCKALAVSNITFSVSSFFEVTEQLAKENIEIRENFNVDEKPLIFFIENLVKILDDDDIYKTHTRSLLTRQSRQISDARSENCARAWLNWARKLYVSLTGQSFTSESITELRLAIEEKQARIVAENALSKQKLSYSS
ncbi:phage head-tail adaptor, putative family protein [Trichomonas vaginalis G3]|uniref:Phage head-tail adaptor, putative family protein n=1 Tax=Trichomonas vaginalis (strain ATCC PRA-98 / G3) TaxID=412133 RepID=A2D829_TRIV3|nr:phage head-tail adaptor family protein [Trichomonas vaginalis G3]EAY23462.1 phage head-tail adaptor, putative family protein [Trichomonas vaginalis G3]KAI5493879.1 exported serine/threonine protein kinase family [Trichomonas vaginalis G3]|eukprot:XP_001584448.1 phage head-tail adaptor family protein [Trichomonas vaginalis G3]